MKKNLFITTGGSGGHVIPAIVLYEHLSKKNNVTISSDIRGLRFLDNDISDFVVIDTPKLNNIFFLPFNIIKILLLTLKSYFLLKNKNIEKIFSTGGYMSLPIILAAKILNLNIYLLEPNQILGRANKFFLNTCKKILCYNNQIKNFPENLKNKIVIINPLIRKNIYELNNSIQVKTKFTILIVGGSQGANIFDKNLKNSISNISKSFSIKIIQQTNQTSISYLSNFYKKNNIENEVFSFDKNFANLITKADLCISRAGASTLAELSFLNVPFIAVPLPTSKDNHQYENANFYRENDCCWLINQDQFEEEIEVILRNILNNKKDYLQKKANLKKINYQNTWNNVNQKIIGIINEN